jgi:thymidine phosphorylase
MLVLGGVAEKMAAARKRVQEVVDKGLGFRKFQEVVAAQGGDPVALEDLSRLPTANRTEDVVSASRGFVQRIDAEEVGIAAMLLGAGRTTVDARIDPGAGVVLHHKVGDLVEEGTQLATLYFSDASKRDEARTRIEAAFTIADQEPPKRKLIHKIIS